jgi:hypothetical protein
MADGHKRNCAFSVWSIENELNLILGAIWIGSSYLNGFLQAISGIFMLLALNKIKAVLRHGIEAD